MQLTKRGKQQLCNIVMAGILVCLLSAGCARKKTHGIEATAAPSAESGEYATRLVIEHKGLARAIEIVDIKQRYVGDRVQQHVTLRNKVKRTAHIKYKFAWYDDEDIEVSPEAEAWKPLILYGKGTKSVSGVAPNPTATSFKIEIKVN